MSSNLIAQYETADGTVEFHGTAGGITVFVGERMVQKDLGMRDFTCYMAHVLQAVHHRLSRSSEADQRDAARWRTHVRMIRKTHGPKVVEELLGIVERNLPTDKEERK